MNIRVDQLKLNQIVVHYNGVSTLFSYNTPVVSRLENGEIELHTDWAYSATTSKYRSMFLNGETTKETKKKLLDGVYMLRRYYENT